MMYCYKKTINQRFDAFWHHLLLHHPDPIDLGIVFDFYTKFPSGGSHLKRKEKSRTCAIDDYTSI